ncbi:hypothetical protein V2J09_014683 [Rumex salicifolius]
MPITLQKKRSYKNEIKSISNSIEQDNIISSSDSFLSKSLTRIPAALLLLLVIFLWSSSTTFISGSIVHVCVTSRKLSHHLYCLSAGDQTTDFETLNPKTENYTSPVFDVVTNPLSLVSKSSIKEDTTSFLINNKAPSSVTRSSNGGYTKQLPKEAKDPIPKNEIKISHDSKVKTPASIVRDQKSKNGTTTPSSIAIRAKTVIKSKREEEIEVARKDVEEQMDVLRSYNKPKLVNYSNPEVCEGRKIYVYDLPTKFNKELLGYCSDMMSWLDFCNFLSNNAFGEAVPLLGNGWYNTHQYALEPIFHARVLKHPCRVYDPEEAKLFYVPYYGGFDILRWHFKENTSVELKDKLSYELMEWLNQHKSWKRNFGLDHLFVLGKITWDFRRVENVGWGTKFLDLDEMQNPMKLLIERQPWQINDIGVPHPSFFHPKSDDDIRRRKNLVSFVGAPRPKDRESIRSILIEQCTSASDKCGFFDCSERRCTKTEVVVENLMDSEFCLQPPGDSPTRKSVFDSLVAGCIPVLFDPFTAYYQYPWHLPANRSEYSVFVDQEAVRRREVNVIDRLAAVPAERKAEMRRRIVDEVLPGLVYADPEGKLERFEDAFTVAINAVLQRMISLP